MTIVTSKSCIKNEHPTVPENLTPQRACKLNLPKRACKLNPKRACKLNPKRTCKLHLLNMPTNLSHQMCLQTYQPTNVPATYPTKCAYNLSHQMCLQTYQPTNFPATYPTKCACKLINPQTFLQPIPQNVPANLSTHKRSCKLIPPNVPANLSTHKRSCKLIPQNVPAKLSHQTCLLVMATLAKRKRTKASIMVFSSISKRSEHLRK